MILNRYKMNLRVIGDSIFSYNTLVAQINHDLGQVIRLGYWSRTSSKHVNYVARILGYDVVDS